MTASSLNVGTEPPSLAALDACLDRPPHVTTAAAALRRVARGQEWVAQLMPQGEAVYSREQPELMTVRSGA